MSFLVLCILCIVQGLTEFLPVSSSGHLLLFEQLFNIKGNLLLLNLFLHMATLIAVIIVYRKIIWKLIKKPFQPLTYKLILSTLITLVFALTYEIFDIDNFVVKIYGFCFLITAVLLLCTHKFQKKACVVKTGELSVKSAIIVGVVQGFAVLPGISRSGSTISSLILTGNDESASAEYSFLLSIPIILGGFIFELIKLFKQNNLVLPVGVFECVFAFVLTFVVSIISLKLTIKLLKKNKFVIFSIYLFLVGTGVLLLNYIFWYFVKI